MESNIEDEEKGIITEVGINQKIFSKLPKLFEILVEYVSEQSYDHFFNLCNGLKSIKDHEKLDKDWYKNIVVSALRAILVKYPIVKSLSAVGTASLRKLSECIIIKESKKEGEEELLSLLTSLYPETLVSDNSMWAHTLWKEENIKLWETKDVCEDLALKSNIDSIVTTGNIDKYTWYNQFLAFVLRQNELLLKEYALLPNMNGDLKKRDADDFKQADGVTDVVLDILAELGEDMRAHLLHKSITAVTLDSKFNSISYSAKANSLAKVIIESTQYADAERLFKLKPLISTVVSDKTKYETDFIKKRSDIFTITKELFGWTNAQAIEDNSFNKSAWEATDAWQKKHIISSIASKESLANLPIGLGAKWLNGTIMSLGITLAEMDKSAIVPNQNGNFCYSKSLFIDNDIPEILKNDVFKKIGISYKDILLDKAIDLKALGKTSSKSIDDFANELSESVVGYQSRNNYFNIYSYGGYRRYNEDALRQVSQFLIQVLPSTDDNNERSMLICLRDTARFFLGEAYNGIDETIDFTDKKLWNWISSSMLLSK